MASGGQPQLMSPFSTGDQHVIRDKKSKSLVIAMHFGTTYSGYAFSWKDDYNNDPTKVSVNPPWVAGSMSHMSLEAPTCILFDENKQFHSFGYAAENAYGELAFDGEHESWYFFRPLKMRLHSKKIHRGTEIEDDKGRKMPAMKVFAEMIRYLKQHLFDLLESRGTGMEETDVHFVLTVPAIWTDSAKQFMREAAAEAGIDGGQLSISLEPEAVSLFCQLIPTEEVMGSTGAKFAVACPGTKYMVIDLGGDNVDITVHERKADGNLKEVHKASRGAWGGTKVDEEFNHLLIAIVGAPVFKKFCDENKPDQLDLQRELETKKRTITPDMTGKITFKIPTAISSTYEREMDESINDAIAYSPYAGKMKWLNDKLRIDADLVKGLFKVCNDRICNHVKELLKKPGVQGTNIFLMIGGFSESAMVQDAVTKAINEVLPNGKIIIPEDAGLCVLKGAAILGHRPVAITHRVAKFTYGINVSPPFDEDRHPEDHKVSVDGFERCRDVFKKYIQKGDTMQVGEGKSGKHITLKPSQKEIYFEIFVSSRQDPKFVDEDGCELLGHVVVSIPDSANRVKVKIRMIIWESSVEVEAEELVHHTKTRAFFDFL